MKAQDDLEAAWGRLNKELSNLDSQPAPGPIRARSMREGLTKHMDGLTDNAAGRRIKCAEHPSELAWNCGSCRGERDGKAHDDPPHKGKLPDMTDEERELRDRILGEAEPEREHRI